MSIFPSCGSLFVATRSNLLGLTMFSSAYYQQSLRYKMFNTHTVYFYGDVLGMTLPCLGRHEGPPGKQYICSPGLLFAGNQVKKSRPPFVLCRLHENWQWLKLSMAIGDGLKDE